MQLFLPGDSSELSGRIVGQAAHPFSLFLPAAKAELFQAGNSQILIQTLRSELFAVTVYEAVSIAEQRLEIVFGEPLLSLLFSITGSITLQDCSNHKLFQNEARYALNYCPAGRRLGAVLPPGVVLLVRLDFDISTLIELTGDYPAFHRLVRSFQRNNALGRQQPQVAIDPFIKWSIRQISEYAETRSERSLFIHSRSIDLLRYYIHSLQIDRISGSTSAVAAPLKQVAAFIEQHLDTPISKGLLARSHGISVRSLERYFEVCFGQSFGRFILQRRMAKARDLLAETSLPILDISLMVGYSELTNFSRAFKAFHGYLPSQVRK